MVKVILKPKFFIFPSVCKGIDDLFIYSFSKGHTMTPQLTLSLEFQAKAMHIFA